MSNKRKQINFDSFVKDELTNKINNGKWKHVSTFLETKFQQQIC